MKRLAQLFLASCLMLILSACERSSDQPAATSHVAVTETHIQSLEPAEDAVTANDTVQTRFGKLEIVQGATTDKPSDTLNLDGKQVFRQDGFFLSLHQYIRQNERDLVLFSSNCGDTSCPRDQLYFLLLDKDSKPEVISKENFFAYPDDIGLQAEGERLILDLGFEAGQHKSAVMEGKELSITLKKAEKTFLGEEDCQWLYNDALGACQEYRDTDTKCAEPQSSFSADLMRGVSALSDHPGFGSDAFGRYCFSTCDTSARPAYPAFAKDVCSK
jgi:hypothetical protein